MKFFCVYTEQIAKSTEGLKRCIESGKKFGIDVSPYKSVWCKDAEDEAKNLNVKLKYRPSSSTVTDFYKKLAPETRIANGITHFKLYEYSVKNNTPIAILEHDAYFVDNPPDPIDDGIIQISCTSAQWTTKTLYECSRANKMKKYEPKRNYDWNWNKKEGVIIHPLSGMNSTSGYIVGPKAASKMVEYLRSDGIGFADRVRSAHIGEGNLYLQNPQSVVCDHSIKSIGEIK